jgi:hypothetical protein
MQVFREEAYNAKVDIFAAALMLYQIFAQNSISSAFQTESDAYAFAQRVTNGYRPPHPKKFPPKLVELLDASWAESPVQRPTAVQMLAQLRHFEKSSEWAEMTGVKGGRRGVCCFG